MKTKNPAALLNSNRIYMYPRRTRTAAAVALGSTLIASAVGQVVEWGNVTGVPDPWFDSAGNWLGGVAPLATDTALFNQAGTYEVWWNALTVANTPTIKVLDINQGNITLLQNDAANPATQHQLTITGVGTYSDFSVSGAGTTLTVSGLNLTDLGGLEVRPGAALTLDGSHAAGTQLSVGTDMEIWDTLNVQAGALLNNAANSYVGRPVPANGVATVTGGGSQWNTAGTLSIGQLGHGTLNIADGGVVSSATALISGSSNAVGLVSVTGAGSQWNNSGAMRIGSSGVGTLNILNGGLVTADQGYLGFNNLQTGSMLVDGVGSQWISSTDLTIGNDGNGTLNVQAGGVVASNIGYIGRNVGSTGVATVTGVGSQWNNAGILYAGESGNGTLNVLSGGVVVSGAGLIANSPGSAGVVTVDGADSQWSNQGLTIGYAGDGAMAVQNGGLVTTNGHIYVGRGAGSTGSVIVTGAGSQLNGSLSLVVGNESNGTVTVEDGGTISVFLQGRIGTLANSTGTVTVSGAGSKMSYVSSNSALYVGESGSGTLNINDGGLVTVRASFIGYNSGSTGGVNVSGTGSQFVSSFDLIVGRNGNGTLNLLAGGGANVSRDATIGSAANGSGSITINGSGSFLNVRDLLMTRASGATGTLNIENAGALYSRHAYIGGFGAAATASVTGAGSQWINTGDLFAGRDVSPGTLTVSDGGLVSSNNGVIGHRNGQGTATITGGGSQWVMSGDLSVGGAEGESYGDGTLVVEDGGLVSSNNAYIGRGDIFPATGVATVTGIGSQWNTQADLVVGEIGSGTLNVLAGGAVGSDNASLGLIAGSTGVATVNGSGSQWNMIGDLNVGGDAIGSGGSGTVNIQTNGLVSVGGTTRIWGAGAVNLDGGTFNFGQTTLSEYISINAVSGTLSGIVLHSGYSDITTLASYELAQNDPNVDITGVSIGNTGVIYGDGTLNVSLVNLPGGTVETIAGERMHYTGGNNSNQGQINLGQIAGLGGQIRFDQGFINKDGGEFNNYGGQLLVGTTFTNEAGGLVGGRGQFIANGGWTNDGAMAFSGGFADIHGDLSNGASGTITIAGGITTTFYDDVTMDAANMNIEVGSDSYAVFLGSYNGSSTGTGTVHAFGDLRPGHSPAAVSFGGDLVLGATTLTLIELGGLQPGQFDQLFVAGDLSLAGSLSVSLIDGFQLSYDQRFLIADVAGERFGFFDGLGEGDLVGNYGGVDLFITYAAGDGNDTAIFSAVPEPSGAVLLMLCIGVPLLRRWRN